MDIPRAMEQFLEDRFTIQKLSSIRLIQTDPDLMTEPFQLSLPGGLLVLQEPKPLADDLTGRLIASRAHAGSDKLFQLGRQRDVQRRPVRHGF